MMFRRQAFPAGLSCHPSRRSTEEEEQADTLLLLLLLLPGASTLLCRPTGSALHRQHRSPSPPDSDVAQPACYGRPGTLSPHGHSSSSHSMILETEMRLHDKSRIIAVQLQSPVQTGSLLDLSLTGPARSHCSQALQATMVVPPTAAPAPAPTTTLTLPLDMPAIPTSRKLLLLLLHVRICRQASRSPLVSTGATTWASSGSSMS